MRTSFPGIPEVTVERDVPCRMRDGVTLYADIYRAAEGGAPSLVTICPGFTSSQYYEGWTYNQGAFALALAASWALGLAAETARRAGDDDTLQLLTETSLGGQSAYWSLPLREHAVLARHAPYYLDWLEHSRYDDYWRRWSIDEDYGRIRVPALHIVGWWDVFLSGAVANVISEHLASRRRPASRVR